MKRSRFRVIPPREPARAKGKRPKSTLRHIEHVRYGLGKVLAVRQIDGSNGYMADVQFGDGNTRTIRLDQAYWITPISDLLSAPPKPTRRVAKPENDASNADGEPRAAP